MFSSTFLCQWLHGNMRLVYYCSCVWYTTVHASGIPLVMGLVYHWSWVWYTTGHGSGIPLIMGLVYHWSWVWYTIDHVISATVQQLTAAPNGIYNTFPTSQPSLWPTIGNEVMSSSLRLEDTRLSYSLPMGMGLVRCYWLPTPMRCTGLETLSLMSMKGELPSD